jgi:hypothetical protein
LEQSEYASSFVEGHSLSVSRSYHSTGVDPATGLYTFETHNRTGQPGFVDMVPNKGLDPRYYAGWDQTIQWGFLELEFLFDYRRQQGLNPLIVLARQNPPGAQGIRQLSNGPVEWLSHWRKVGDHSAQQRVSTGMDPVAGMRLQDYLASDAWSIDASYLRLRETKLSFRFPTKWLSRWKVQSCRLYLYGRNLWTSTHFPVTDPETQDPRVLAPMRNLSVGLHVSF